jgi:hypothetical protein
VTTDPDWPTVRRALRAAVLRKVAILVLVYTAPPLRRFRRWYWRFSVATAVVGAAIGLAMEYLDRHDPDAIA